MSEYEGNQQGKQKETPPPFTPRCHGADAAQTSPLSTQELNAGYMCPEELPQPGPAPVCELGINAVIRAES